MIDIHNHLLPGIDDGSPTLADALALARACVADGITHVVATPHVFPGLHDNLRSNIETAYARFRAELVAIGLPLTLSWAGEVRLTPEVLDLLDAGEIPFLGHSAGLNNMLLEMPDGQIPLGTDGFIGRLLQRGVRPVIVHPERNKAVMNDPERVRPFVDAGCVLQLTAGSLVGQFGERAQSVSQRLLDEGWAGVVASDSHNLKARGPRMSAAREVLIADYGIAAAFELLAATPAALCGLPAPAPWNRVVDGDLARVVPSGNY